MNNKHPKPMSRFLKNGFLNVASLVFSALILLGAIYFYLALNLPDVTQLKDARLQVPLKVYTHDGKLIGIFGEKKRIPIKLDQVPKPLIYAILDTEDQRYYEHPGVDFIGLIRAAKNVFSTGKKSQGASTITMQVARNFFLNSDKTYGRKINEIMLALKIDQSLSKDEILELYINKIYLGQRAYGVAAASQIYFGKDIHQLTLPEMAMIAGLPQAPSRDNPIANPEAALERRNHVLNRMLECGHIDETTYKNAVKTPLTSRYHEQTTEVNAPYVAEMVRTTLVKQYGTEIYDQGINVYTTIDSRLQTNAESALRQGVISYDERHGFRGSEENFGAPSIKKLKNWQKDLKKIPSINGLFPAIVLNKTEDNLRVLLADGLMIDIPCQKAFAKTVHSAAKLGDLIRVGRNQNNAWDIYQAPKAEASLVAMNPKNGAILALTGGFSYGKSNFNRAVQAYRQTGSAFKPFIYSAALEKGFTMASLVNDAPIVTGSIESNTLWRPQNDSLRFYGPTRLRLALMRSQNLVSIRLLQAIGVSYAVDYLERFGFERNQLPYNLSLALGTGSTTPLLMTRAYATFANGGYLVTPYFIDSISDKNGKVLFKAQPKIAPSNNFDTKNKEYAERIITAQNAYIITDALKDVIRGGTARHAKALNRDDLAGKTGTTNEQKDTWFCGFNSDIVASVWLGFDQPESVREHSSKAALPIWMDFMGKSLAGTPSSNLAEPEGITTARIDPTTGLLANEGAQNAIFEIFANSTAPQQIAPANQEVENKDGNTEKEEPLF